ncbi:MULTISPECIES: helix-turn-helix domain-containing protein [unclassified Chryseobacterium]|uniref:helix-turn-helix domain-containing protein n=1 Tax=unclassified Chryseobacterium TaxID=2593645 RepID=UPI002853481D|nr:helix-turn-helix domain-containing protein [Chryseobacterium sp. CFS7]MDR4892134.1 helix-turn-helix domain-containing protein [Chryseobacterium sp. CFS7]
MIKEFSFKKFGNLEFSKSSAQNDSLSKINEHIKVLFIPQKAIIQVDFEEIEMKTDTLLFINPHVILKPCETIRGQLMHFNKDFYCVEIHDHEVACDGILYNNVFEIPFINLNKEQSAEIQKIISDIQFELKNEDSGTEEMLRTLLKLIILKSTRIWKQHHHLADNIQQADVQFLRKFSKLVEQHFKTLHTVADYADLLCITPKNLSKKISMVSKDTPNEIIKNRIILESKRLLAHTTMSVKEIAYTLNYEDDAYFVRFFTKHTGMSPTSFRKQF